MSIIIWFTVEDQNRLLGTMDQEMGTAAGMLNASIGQLSKMLSEGKEFRLPQ